MRVMVAARQAGKTTRIVEILKADPNGALITHSVLRADQLRREHPELADQIYPVRQEIRGHNFSNLYVDDIDLVLAALLDKPVTFGTMTAAMEFNPLGSHMTGWNNG